MSRQFDFRTIRQQEAEQAIAIEQICFPAHEACSPKSMQERIAATPELFLVAIDSETKKIAGFLNGVATEEEAFRDEFFTDIQLHKPDGYNVMLLGLDVLPQYRGQGLATAIVKQYIHMAQKHDKKTLVLTCLPPKVAMYEKMGFANSGIADSSWGDEQWYEMRYQIKA